MIMTLRGGIVRGVERDVDLRPPGGGGAGIALVQEAWYRLRRMGFTELTALFR